MHKAHNVIDNGRFNKLNNNVIDNVSNKTEKQVDAIAARIMAKLDAKDGSRKWYCKIAWKLSEHQIESHLETALKGKDPQRYFSWLCKRCM